LFLIHEIQGDLLKASKLNFFNNSKGFDFRKTFFKYEFHIFFFSTKRRQQFFYVIFYNRVIIVNLIFLNTDLGFLFYFLRVHFTPITMMYHSVLFTDVSAQIIHNQENFLSTALFFQIGHITSIDLATIKTK